MALFTEFKPTLFDHSHIQTRAHGKLFKTGEVQLNDGFEIVGISMEGFRYNHAQRRQDAVFGVTHPNRGYLGSFYASAFKSLFL